MTGHQPCCVRWCAAITLAGSIVGALYGWLTYDEDEGV